MANEKEAGQRRWRPKDWDRVRRDRLEVVGIGSWGTCDIYESGADAMLKALRETGERTTRLFYAPDDKSKVFGKEVKGCSVFIPEEG